MMAKTNIELALGLIHGSNADARRRIVERALGCAGARGDEAAVTEFLRMQREQQAAIASAEKITLLVCLLSGAVLKG